MILNERAIHMKNFYKYLDMTDIMRTKNATKIKNIELLCFIQKQIKLHILLFVCTLV